MASREQVLAFQAERLRRLVRHCYDRVPHYRMLFDKTGLRPEDIKGLEDLQYIPLTSRGELQFLPVEEILARGTDPGALYARRTSGSTGRPLMIRRSHSERARLSIYQWRMYRSLGNRVSDRRASIGLIRHRHEAPQAGERKPLYRRLGLFPVESIDILLPAHEILARLREIQPDILISSSAAAAWLAGEMSEQDQRRIRPRFIVTWGETLTDTMRRQIREGFQSPVFDYYISHEFGPIAIECGASGNYHIFDQSLIVEVLKDGRPVQPGEEGEMVGTSLHSYAMPFLRYRIGDMVTQGHAACPCGAPFSTITRIDGRVIDRIVLPDGNTIHPYAVFLPVVADRDWVRRFQFIQEREDFIQLKLVPHETPAPDEVAALRDAVVAKLGLEMHVEVELVKEISPSRTGKFYPYVSLERYRAWQDMQQDT